MSPRISGRGVKRFFPLVCFGRSHIKTQQIRWLESIEIPRTFLSHSDYAILDCFHVMRVPLFEAYNFKHVLWKIVKDIINEFKGDAGHNRGF